MELNRAQQYIQKYVNRLHDWLCENPFFETVDELAKVLEAKGLEVTIVHNLNEHPYVDVKFTIKDRWTMFIDGDWCWAHDRRSNHYTYPSSDPR